MHLGWHSILLEFVHAGKSHKLSGRLSAAGNAAMAIEPSGFVAPPLSLPEEAFTTFIIQPSEDLLKNLSAPVSLLSTLSLSCEAVSTALVPMLAHQFSAFAKENVSLARDINLNQKYT